MKTIKIFMFLFATLAVLACKNKTEKEAEIITVEENKTKENTAEAVYTMTSFEIAGMTCAQGCAATIEKKLAKMEGVQTAEVNFDTKKAIISYDEAKVGFEDIAMTVTTTGNGETYKVLNMKKTEKKATTHTCGNDCSKETCTHTTEKDTKTCSTACKKECCTKKA